MRYSEFLKLVIDTVPEYLLHVTSEYFFICQLLDYLENHKEVQAEHVAKLRKTVKIKIKGYATLGPVLGYSNEARIAWLDRLAKYHASRGN